MKLEMKKQRGDDEDNSQKKVEKDKKSIEAEITKVEKARAVVLGMDRTQTVDGEAQEQSTIYIGGAGEGVVGTP
jgi:hypothetical protein